MTKQITPEIDMSALVLVDNNCGVVQSRYITFKFEK